jgi:hypothetical protein
VQAGYGASKRQFRTLMVSSCQKATRLRTIDASARPVPRSRRPHACTENFMRENREALSSPAAVSGPEGERDER